MNEVVEVENKNVVNLIYEIRGKQVMLDSDLAKLYGCKNGTKSINLAVKRHINRFPERFMFQLTMTEVEYIKKQSGVQNNSRFQVETLNKNNQKQGLNIKYLPYAFTEQGVAMLSAVLKTSVAEKVSVAIMDAFVIMKKYISNNLIEQKYINNQVLKNTEEIKLLQESFKKFEKKNKNTELFYKGQIYDAYSLMIDILNSSEEKIVIIDNYVDKEILDICSKVHKKISIITNKYSELNLKKYKKQYNNVEIFITSEFHDRFIILDNKELYHCGASFKDLGKKCFSINRIEDKSILMELLNHTKTII